jgi:hypothetical protein
MAAERFRRLNVFYILILNRQDAKYAKKSDFQWLLPWRTWRLGG